MAMAASGRSSTVFIGNIPYDASEEDLRGIFSRVGSIDALRLVYDKDTKQPKGYAFCDYSDADTALSAIRNLSEVECNGRRLRIDLADNALRIRDAAAKSGGVASVGPLPLALPAPELRNRLSIPAMPPPGPAPVGPPLPAGVVPMRPPGPSGQRGGSLGDGGEGAGSPEAVIAAVSAHTEIAQTVAAMPQAQHQLCIGTMQQLAVEAPEATRTFLQENPQLCHALLHAQLLLELSLDPKLPPSEEEIQLLRAEAARRVPMLAPVASPCTGMVVPPASRQGLTGVLPRPTVVGPPFMGAFGGIGQRPFGGGFMAGLRPPASAMMGGAGGLVGGLAGGLVGGLAGGLAAKGMPTARSAPYPSSAAEVARAPGLGAAAPMPCV